MTDFYFLNVFFLYLSALIRYQVIGMNNVAVPTHFFKAVVCESEGGELSMESYVMPNRPIPDEVPIQSFMVSLCVGGGMY